MAGERDCCPISKDRYGVGLCRVTTDEQSQSDLGLEAKQATVRAFAAAQGWTLVAEFSDVASGKDDRRPGFQAALTPVPRALLIGCFVIPSRME